MKKNLQMVDRVLRVILALLAGFAAWGAFQNPVARGLAAIVALWSLTEAILGVCPLHNRNGVKSMSEWVKKDPVIVLILIQLVIAYQWWLSGWQKLSSGEFVASLGQTLEYFASQNPFPLYQSFLTGFAMEHATTIAYLCIWGEFAVAVALLIGAKAYVYFKDTKIKRWAMMLSKLALEGGLIMNANYYLAASWTGPGTRGINVVMFGVQAVLVFIYISILMENRKSQV